MDIFIGLKSNHCLVSAWVSKSVKSVRKSSCWHGIVKVFTRIYETWKECPKKKLLIEFRCTQFRTIATLNRSLPQLGVSSSQEGGTRWSVAVVQNRVHLNSIRYLTTFPNMCSGGTLYICLTKLLHGFLAFYQTKSSWSSTKILWLAIKNSIKFKDSMCRVRCAFGNVIEMETQQQI